MHRNKNQTGTNNNLRKAAFCDESDAKFSNTKADSALYQQVHSIHLEKKRKEAERSEETKFIEDSYRKLCDQREAAQAVSSLETIQKTRKTAKNDHAVNPTPIPTRPLRPATLTSYPRKSLTDGENRPKFSSFLPCQTTKTDKDKKAFPPVATTVNRSNSIAPRSFSQVGFASTSRVKGLGKPRAKSAPGRSLRELRTLTHIDIFSLSLSGKKSVTVITHHEKLIRRQRQEELIIQKKVDNFVKRIAEFNRSNQQKNSFLCSTELDP